VLAQSVGEKTGVNSALGISPTAQDFVKEVVTSDMLELAAAKIAQEKGKAEKKKFAEQMFQRYSRSGDNPKLKDWAGKTLPALQHHLDMAEAMSKSRD
jgi:putative membrane protein